MGIDGEPLVGWSGDNVLVQDERRPFVRRIRRLLQVDGLPALRGLPSDVRREGGTDTLGFYSYPLLFYTSFPGVTLRQLRSLSTAGSYLFDHVLCLDDLLDRQSGDRDGTVLLSGELHREAMTRLCGLFPRGSPFWTHVERYHAHFADAVLREGMHHRQILQPYSTPELELIYSGKAAVAKTCLAALAELGGDSATRTALEASHDLFYVGFQLADDLEDYRVDYERAHYTYPLSVALLHAGWRPAVESRDRPNATAVGELLVRTGVAEETRGLALTYFDRAERAVASMPQGSWSAAIRSTRDRVAGRDFAPTGPPEEMRVGYATAVDRPAQPLVGLSLVSPDGGTVAPVAGSWRAWLDLDRPPQVTVERVLATQRRALRAGPAVRTVGAALYHVGRAVRESLTAFPDLPLDVHLGVSAGELAWFRRHDTALDALLAAALDEQPELWSPSPGPGSGWLPPAVGRYLGHRLVADGAAVLDRYRMRTSA